MRVVAASSYSFHRLVKAAAQRLIDAPRLARDAGADAIEFALGPPLSPALDDALADALRASAERAGLSICSVVISAELYRGDERARSQAVESVIAQLEAAQRMGAMRFRHDATLGPADGDLSDAAFERALPVLADSCRTIAERAEALGMVSSIENHGRFVQHAERVAQLIEAVDHPCFGVTLDVGNSLFAKQDPVDAARRLAPFAITVHVKDFIINPTPQRAHGPYVDADVWETYIGGPMVLGCALGDGDLDIEACIDAVRRSGFDGPWVVEFEGPAPEPLEAMRRGIAWLREVLGQR